MGSDRQATRRCTDLDRQNRVNEGRERRVRIERDGTIVLFLHASPLCLEWKSRSGECRRAKEGDQQQMQRWGVEPQRIDCRSQPTSVRKLIIKTVLVNGSTRMTSLVPPLPKSSGEHCRSRRVHPSSGDGASTTTRSRRRAEEIDLGVDQAARGSVGMNSAEVQNVPHHRGFMSDQK